MRRVFQYRPLIHREISWHLLIPAAAVEDEIKSIYFAIGKPLARVGAFKSGGYQKVEQQFAWVATMFGILAEHSQAERWKEVAARCPQAFFDGKSWCKGR